MLKNRGNKLKKLILSAILLATVTSSYACTFTDSTTEDIRTIIKDNGGLPISDKNCALLNSNNMGISINAVSTVLLNTSVGWASVAVIDIKTNITSDKTGVATKVNSSSASIVVADKLMYEAIKNSMDKLDLQKAIQEVKAYRAKALK
jgi:hypothetical protein